MEIEGERGFQVIFGAVNFQTPSTGEMQRISAASLVFSGKDAKKVLWSAP